MTQEVRLSATQQFFVVEGVRGGDDITQPYGDICIDDFMLQSCSGKLSHSAHVDHLARGRGGEGKADRVFS